MASQQQDLGGPLICKAERSDGATRVTLSGHVNETTDLMPLLRLPQPLRIDLSGIDRINSIGVMSWVKFVHEAERMGVDLTVERCSPIIVGQIGMISNFMGTRTRVASVYVVYVCPSCHAEQLQLVELPARGRLDLAPTVPCAKCRASMQLDEIEHAYTRLLERR